MRPPDLAATLLESRPDQRQDFDAPSRALPRLSSSGGSGPLVRPSPHLAGRIAALLLIGGGTACSLLFPSNDLQPVFQCSDAADCKAPTPVCLQGVCASRCEGVSCAEGFRCDERDGSCVAYQGAACEEDQDCDSAHPQCVEGSCHAARLGGCQLAPCSPGLECVSFTGGERCLAPCVGDQSCLSSERCLDASFGSLGGYCAPSLCRPSGEPGNPMVWKAAFGDPCGPQLQPDSFCLGPLPDPRLGEIGLCHRAGSALPGASCDLEAAQSSAQSCKGGLCVAAFVGQTGQGAIGQCLSFCSIWGRPCEPGGACMPQWGAQGLCFELASSPAKVGASCVPSIDGRLLACETGSLCLPEDLAAAPRRCLSLCDPFASASAAHSCAQGSCRLWDPAGNPYLGVCVL